MIDLCASMFNWARFRRTKGAVKLHLLLDHEGCLPTFALLTEGKLHDMKGAWALDLPADSVIVMDRGYVDYLLFGTWTERGVWFVTRMKDNAAYRVVERWQVTEGRGVISDEEIELTGQEARVTCPHRLRRIVYRDADTD